MVIISVIIPVYNVEPYLRQCVDSILNQTFRNLELILVDDGSPDGCPAICDDYTRTDSRVKVIHKQNGGLSSARNAGLDVASGDYIAFVDSDDWVEPDYLEQLLNAAQTGHSDLTMCNFQTYYPPEHSGWKRTGSTFSSATMSCGEFADFLAESDHWRAHIVWNKLYSVHLWKNLRFPEGCIHEDEAVLHRIVAHCNSIQIIEDSLYHYRQNISTSIMGQGMRAQSVDRLLALADRILCASEQGWEKLYVSSISAYVYHLLEWASLFPQTEENRPYFRRMRDSLKTALPYILKSPNVSVRQKLYVSLIRLNPKLYTTLKNWKP